MSSEVPEFTILYHFPKKMKGRGEFLRLMLEDAGVTNYGNTDENLYGPDGMMDAFRGSIEGIDADTTDFPLLFPPAILHRPSGGSEPLVLVNQVGACMIYLGDVLGYAPKTNAEKARANCIMLNCLDYLADGRVSFHPVKNTASYHDQEEEGNRVSKEFTKDRMLKYLHHFNKVIKKTGGPEKPIAGGEAVTYADFVLFHVLDATKSQFNSEFYEHAWDKTVEKLPLLKEYHEWIANRPNLKTYFESERCTRK